MYVIYFQLSLEFLDLSGVDEKEQLKLRVSLQHNDPSVQLPWIKSHQKHTTDSKFFSISNQNAIFINSYCTIIFLS